MVARRTNLYLARRRFKQQHGCQPVRNRFHNQDPLLGLDAIWRTVQRAKAGNILDWVMWRARTYGPTFASRESMEPPTWLGGRESLVTADPENIKAVLATRARDYGHSATRHVAFAPLLGAGIFVSDGARWHESRALLRPSFAREQVADLASLERHMGLFLSLIPRGAGDTVDLQMLFFRLTMDTATEFLFGSSVESLRALKDSGGGGLQSSSASDSAFAEAMNDAQADIIFRARLGMFYHLQSNKRGKAAIKFVHEYVDRFVDEALRQDAEKGAKSNGDEKYVFSHELVKATKDRKVIRDEIVNILLAGRDTTASLLTNLFFVLAKRPDVWRKLKQEVAELDGQLPTYEALKSLKYVRWCLNESLRIHPVVPMNDKVALVDTLLPRGGGPDGQAPLFVEKGSIVTWAVYALHRREDLYGADADEFRPERWETLRPGWEYLPFNGGPRICVGQQYALTEAAYVTIRLVQEFARIESRDPGPWVEGLGLTVCSRNGTKVGLYRESS
ncbi:uncharacterized protein PG998_008978 [Apiospora kogelbergensis]|uniref:uncharacterized protein n=1 Tax=Apiospora kogelbergensis TaxID=1337665 RepID=UPI0031301849